MWELLVILTTVKQRQLQLSLKVQADKGLAQFKSYADIAKGGTVRDETKTVTIAVAHVEYETDNRHYAHVDCPGHADFVKNMIPCRSNGWCYLSCFCSRWTYATNS